MVKICIPIRKKSLQKAEKQVKRAAEQADFIEIWLDSFAGQNLESNLKNLIKTAKKPVIAVCRNAKEKGSFRGTEKQRVERLFLSLRAGAKFIDVGIHTRPNFIKKLKTACRKYRAKLIISVHIWKNMLDIEKLEKLALKAKKLGANIIKIATSIAAWEDNVILFELTKRLKERGLECIIVGMGEKAKISRIGCPLLGSFLTYVALDKKSKTAPGQLTLHHLCLCK
ncbi:type I 3-dehydroquinate dehydratase [Candidatus Peregrinibacteria bacterium]|nr:type I 3-dehydroquinate dehydratase [Candidatus Peregrinibacteria bacterium]